MIVFLIRTLRKAIEFVQYYYVVNTGPIDAFYDFRFGEQPYRSLRLEPESFTLKELKDQESISVKKGFWQPAMSVNYLNKE